jgi:hypothetical protein
MEVELALGDRAVHPRGHVHEPKTNRSASRVLSARLPCCLSVRRKNARRSVSSKPVRPLPKTMGSHRLRLRVALSLVLVLVAVLSLSAAQATGAKGRHSVCTLGASSIRARLVHGRFVVSAPAISGCIPH